MTIFLLHAMYNEERKSTHWTRISTRWFVSASWKKKNDYIWELEKSKNKNINKRRSIARREWNLGDRGHYFLLHVVPFFFDGDETSLQQFHLLHQGVLHGHCHRELLTEHTQPLFEFLMNDDLNIDPRLEGWRAMSLTCGASLLVVLVEWFPLVLVLVEVRELAGEYFSCWEELFNSDWILFIVIKLWLILLEDMSWAAKAIAALWDDEEGWVWLWLFLRYFLIMFWYLRLLAACCWNRRVCCWCCFSWSLAELRWSDGMAKPLFVGFSGAPVSGRFLAMRNTGKRSCLDKRWCFFIKWSVRFRTHVSQRGQSRRFFPSTGE